MARASYLPAGAPWLTPWPSAGPHEAVASARESEAADIIFHDGYYYLFVNHGSCCKGKLSEYNIRVGRSRKPDGPYVDRHGLPLAQGARTLLATGRPLFRYRTDLHLWMAEQIAQKPRE